jgi:hypothetical protein
MGSVLVTLGAAVGTGAGAVVLWCAKKHSKYEKVNVRCNYDDSGCTCGVIHEDTELELRMKETKEAYEREKAAELGHAKEIYDKDVELLDKDNQLKIAELELAVNRKDEQIVTLNKMVESIRDDYLRFRDGMSQHVMRSIPNATLNLPQEPLRMQPSNHRPPLRQLMTNDAMHSTEYSSPLVDVMMMSTSAPNSPRFNRRRALS